ncbi:MAG: O-antigen ligase family protein [Patescibacteria group bacterium]
MKQTKVEEVSVDTTAKNVARWVALGALFLLPLMPLMVANSYFFPFITGKAFYFRILVEIAFAAWVVLAFLDKAYRPRFSWVGTLVLAFVVWMGIADAFAINAQKAFWSNFERMEGWVLLVHALGFFVAAGAVLRVEEKWRAWFLTMLGVSSVIVIYALFQINGSLAIHQGSTRIDATLGNSSYLAVYLLLSVGIAVWLALTEQRHWLRWLLIGLATIEGVLVIFTETRGAVIGLAVGLALAAILTALTAGKQARRVAVVGLLMLTVVVGGLYVARNSDAVKNNSTLRRVTSISLNDGATRFTLWNMAWQGTLERPLIGWGQEGYNYIFNKYYEPSLYKQEQWFDRAHNTFIDWLVAGGFPAFFLYIALFVSAMIALWRHSNLSRPERIVLTAALVGYAIHNFFVFDNLVSYLYFFAILALIDSQVARPFPRLERAPTLAGEAGLTMALPVATVLLIVTVWVVNVPGMQVAGKIITALSSQQVETITATFQDLALNPAFAAQEVREQIVNFAASAAQSTQLSDEQKQQIAALAVTEIQKQIKAYPLDARQHLQLAYVYRSFGVYDEALKAMEQANALSPKKIDMYLLRGITAWDKGDTQFAREMFTTAYTLAPQFTDLAEYAAAGELAAGNVTAADAILTTAFGTTTVDSNILATAYYRARNWPRLIALWERRVAAPDATVQHWFSLAAAYYTAGANAQAIAILTEAGKRFPDAAESVREAIKQVQGAANVQ